MKKNMKKSLFFILLAFGSALFYISFLLVTGCGDIGVPDATTTTQGGTTTTTTTQSGTTTTTTTSTTNTTTHNYINDHNSYLQTSIPKPSVNNSYVEPVFGTSVMRLTNALSIGKSGVVPEYSKRQAWNCDESLMLLRAGSGEVLLYNGSTYQFQKELGTIGGDNIFWHPTDPSLLYYFLDNVFYSFNVDSELPTILHTFDAYAIIGMRAEGNISNNGRYCALVGQDVAGDPKALLTYDIISNEVISMETFPVTIESFDWVSISPKGNYVVVDYADEVTGNYHGVEVYDRSFNRLWQKPLGAAHSDLGIDANGDEVLIMGFYDSGTNSEFIKKFLLSDGTETNLLEFSYLFDYHISCRNEQRPGWCFISTFDYVGRLTDKADNPALDWLPFEDEVFALKMDGSGKVERYAHHHSRRYSPITPDSDTSVYISEPHATISRHADRILFGSNWRENVSFESSVDTYVIDLR